MSDLHETHVCRDCGAEITLPYAAPPSDPAAPLRPARVYPDDDVQEAVYRALLYVEQKPPPAMKPLALIRALAQDGYDVRGTPSDPAAPLREATLRTIEVLEKHIIRLARYWRTSHIETYANEAIADLRAALATPKEADRE